MDNNPKIYKGIDYAESDHSLDAMSYFCLGAQHTKIEVREMKDVTPEQQTKDKP